MISLFVLFLRRRKTKATTDEMSFDSEIATDPDDGYNLEDAFSGTGSRHQRLSVAQAEAIYGMSGFEDDFEETRFGF
jgi:hypothetical protein